jgi:cell division protein FtsQ
VGAGSSRARRRVAVGLVVLLLGIGSVVGARALLLGSTRFQVAGVEVTAPAGVDAAQVRAVAGIRLGTPLLLVDTDAVAQAVAQVPAVASVRVSRAWPHTVRLTVTERTPVALTRSATGPWLVDASGLAYAPAGRPLPVLPMLAATRVAPNDASTRAALVVLTSLTEPVRQKLQVVAADGPNAVTLRLDGGRLVLWGSPDESGRKASVLEAILTQRGSFYDVSAPDLPTLRR